VKEFGLEQLFNPKTAGLSSSSDSMTDPVLLFDSQSNRWFAAISDTTVHSIRVAVSQTADPTGEFTTLLLDLNPTIVLISLSWGLVKISL